MYARIPVRLFRAFLLAAFCLAPGLAVPPAHAFHVADGMALLQQDMPANYCALTFDDGPGPHTAALLDLLAERGIVATFFVLGQNAERRPALIQRMLAEGHEVANHSFSHADMRRLKPENQYLEMKRTLDVLQPLGAEVRYFRPPYGRYTPQTVAQAEALGMTIMLWSLDSQDWKRHVSRLEGLRSVSPVAQQTFSGLRGVLLFHDTHKHTVDEMPDILDTLVASGCERFVTVSEYMLQAPREEEHRLSTQAPDGGRGEMPPPEPAARKQLPRADDAAPQLAGEMQTPRESGAGMRTQASHLVQGQSGSMQMQTAHGSAPGPQPAAAPETLMAGIVTHEEAAVPAPQTQAKKPAPVSPAPAPQPRVSPSAKGQIPPLLSDPNVFPRPQTKKGDRNGPG